MFTVNTDFPNAPGVAIRPDMTHFGNNNFTLTLEWPHFSSETYSVATIPETLHINFTTNTSVQLVILYNIQYNVTVTATLCGHRSTVIQYCEVCGNNYSVSVKWYNKK